MAKIPSCIVCGEEITKRQTSFQNWCSPECAIQIVKKKTKKENDQRIKAVAKLYGYKGSGKGKAKAESSNNLPSLKESAKRWCHKYIRMRDRFKPCVCCGKPLGDDFQAGHYIPSGQNPLVRYDERNIHGQRKDCNYFKGGDSGYYRVNLISRIGQDQVEELETMKGGVLKRTADDYREIIKYYKGKCEALQRESLQA